MLFDILTLASIRVRQKSRAGTFFVSFNYRILTVALGFYFANVQGLGLIAQGDGCALA